MTLIARIFLALSAFSAFASASERPFSAEGFYPIWENTGFVESHKTGFIGTNGAHFGVQNRFQLGSEPINFMYRAPNLNFKAKLFGDEDTSISAQAGFFHLMSGASSAFLSPMYSSRLDNPDFQVQLFPLSLSSSHSFSDWLQIHQTWTLLHVRSGGPIVPSSTFGYSVVAEMLGNFPHSVLLHLGEVGFWNHDFATVGISYCRRTLSTEFRLGYFYRVRSDSLQSSPMLGLGFYL